MKRLLWFTFGIISIFWYVTANTTWDSIVSVSTWTSLTGTNVTLVSTATWIANTGTSIDAFTKLNNAKTDLITMLDAKNKSLQDSVLHLNKALDLDEDYILLNKVWKINLNKPDKKNLSDYFNFKTSILLDYNNLSSQKQILDEKLSFWAMDKTDYTGEISKFITDIDGYIKKYEDAIDKFFVNWDKNVEDYYVQIEDIKKSNKILLVTISSKKKSLEDMIWKYQEYKDNMKKINDVYVWNYDSVNDFIQQVKLIITDSITKDLDNVAKTYYDKYDNLDYYSSDIVGEANSLKNNYNLKINAYFNEIFSWFYSQIDIDYIENNIVVFKSRYLVDWKVDYKLLNDNDSLWEPYTKLMNKISDVNAVINWKLNELQNPSDLWKLKEIVKDKIEKYHEQEKQSVLDLFKRFLDKQVELLWYKLSSELESYNNLKKRDVNLQNFSWSLDDKYFILNDLQDQVDIVSKKIISKDLKQELTRRYWELENEKIDIYIKKWSFIDIDKEYPDVDTKLKNILLSIESQFQTQWKSQLLLDKIDKALVKIKSFLTSGSLTKKTEFLLLKIKKVFIWFRYLR